MPYGTVKVDNVTFTNNSVDATTTFSGIYASITNNLTLSGTATAATFTGTTANFTNVNAQNISVTTSLSGLAITGGTAGFTTITGTTVTGTTANFATVSGTTVTGTTARFITITGGTAGFTTITGTTVTGTTANFVTVSGTTVTGTTASFTSGIFTSLSGTTHTITSGVFASGTAALPSISFVSDPNTGIYSPGADQVAVATNGTGRLFVGSDGKILVNTATTANISVVGSTLNPFYQQAATSSAGSASALYHYSATIGGAAGLSFAKSNSATLGTQALVGNTHRLGYISFTGSDGTSFREAVRVESIVNGVPASDDMPGALVVSTTPSGSATPTERLRITSAGLVGIGTSSPTALLEISSDASGTLAGEVLLQKIRSNTVNSVFVGVKSRRHTAGSNWEGVGFRFQHQVDSSLLGFIEFNSLNGGQDVAIGTGGSTRLIVLSTGNVGIGTTSPATKLAVSDTSGTVAIRITSGAGSGDISHTGTDFYIVNNVSAGNIPFYTNSSERVRIDNSGRLLVGTSSARVFDSSIGTLTPITQIESTGAESAFSITRNTAASTGPGLFFGKSRSGSIGGIAVVQDGDKLGTIFFEGTDGTNLIEAATIFAEVDGTPGTNDMPGRLVFSTTADGASSPTERLRITSAGVLQIADAGNITVGTTTGTKIGTATTQKLGFYNATPVVQPTAVADATTAVDVITQLNNLLAKLRTLGIIAT